MPDAAPEALTPRTYQHISALDGVRGLAVLLVLLHHFMPGSPSTLVGKCIGAAAHAGWVGVDLFFVLSGFLITGILLRDRGSPRYFRNFYMRRTLRIFPLYYGVLFVSFAILPLTELGRRSDIQEFASSQGWLWLYLENVLLSIRGKWVLHGSDIGFGHFWSLAVEEHFYLIWPTVVFLVPVRLLPRVCFAGIALAIACRCATLTDPRWILASYVFTPCRIDAPLAGAALAVALHLKMDTLKWCRILAIVCLFSVALIILHNRGLFYRSTMIRTVGFTLIAGMFASLLGLLLHNATWRRLSSVRALTFFGTYSYGIYVFQGWLGPMIMRYFDTGKSLLGSFRLLAIGVAIVIPVSMLSYHLYEARFLRLKRYFQ